MNQLYELALDVSGRLRARHYPFRVHYAPERADRNGIDPVILFMRDRTANEPVVPAAGAAVRQAAAANTKAIKKRDRTIGGAVKIYARASVTGAMAQDHEELADYLADAVICALDEWAVEAKTHLPVYTEARLMAPSELISDTGEPDQFPGVVYLLRFSILRGVYVRTYEKQGRALGLIAGAVNDVEVRLTEGDEPELVPAPPEEDP